MNIPKKILLISLLLCFHTSCEEEITSTIPNAPVNLSLDLMGRDKDLNSPLSYKEYTSRVLETDRLGYGGILVINGIGENTVNLFAYDLTCPNEAQSNVRIKPLTTSLQAKCPKCGAVYNIATGGAAESGSRYWLKRYNVVQTNVEGTSYKVTN